MTQGRMIGLAAVALGVWWLWNRKEGVQPLSIAVGEPVNPMQPSAPDLGKPAIPTYAFVTPDGGYNYRLFGGIALKQPGNYTMTPAESGRPSSPVDPLSPPDVMTKTYQPMRPLFIAEDVRHLPNLGDPNYTAWNYLAVTPPDLAWGLKVRGI